MTHTASAFSSRRIRTWTCGALAFWMAASPVLAQVSAQTASAQKSPPASGASGTPQAPALQAVPSPVGTATLTFFRDARDRLATKDAYISVNGVEIGALAPGFYRSSDEAPGQVELVVSFWDTPGLCKLTIPVEKSGEYYFEVQYRRDAIAAERAGKTIGNVLGSLGVIGAIGGAVGTAMGSVAGRVADKVRSGECSGNFEIRPVDEAFAKRRLIDLQSATLQADTQ